MHSLENMVGVECVKDATPKYQRESRNEGIESDRKRSGGGGMVVEEKSELNSVEKSSRQEFGTT